jgi:RNA polymerase sigma factor (sigma-70 family)
VREPASPNHNLSHFLDSASSIARYVRRRVRDAEVAAEIFQDVSLVVLRHRSAPASAENFYAWCHGVARHAIARHFRKQRRQASLLIRAEPEGHALLAQAPHDPESTFATRELLERMFNGVDERSRRLIIERYLLGHSAEEIAAQAAQSPSSVRMKLMRARGAVLKARLRADFGVDTGSSD